MAVQGSALGYRVPEDLDDIFLIVLKEPILFEGERFRVSREKLPVRRVCIKEDQMMVRFKKIGY